MARASVRSSSTMRTVEPLTKWASRRAFGGEVDPDRRTLAQTARDLQATAILLDVPLGDRQAEPGALLPRGEERLAYRRQCLFGNAAARVAHLEDHGRRPLA